MKKLEPWTLLGRIVYGIPEKKETTWNNTKERQQKNRKTGWFYSSTDDFFQKSLEIKNDPMAHPLTKVWRPISTKIGDMEPLNSLITIWIVNIAMGKSQFSSSVNHLFLWSIFFHFQ
jgi:hypothetical protein